MSNEKLLSKPVLKVKLHATNEERNKLLTELREKKVESSDEATRNSFCARIEKLKSDALLCQRSSDALKLEHGVALSKEMYYSMDLAHLDVQYQLSKLTEVLNDEKKRSDIFERYGAIVSNLSDAARTFNAYADRNMLERCLETLANVYRRTGL